MKLMFIIAGDEYAADISEKLKEHAFMATEVGSTGDFLQYGQTVLLLGVNEQDCDRILSILDPEADWKGTEHGFPFHEEVSIFVTDVNDYVKVNVYEGDKLMTEHPFLLEYLIKRPCFKGVKGVRFRWIKKFKKIQKSC